MHPDRRLKKYVDYVVHPRYGKWPRFTEDESEEETASGHFSGFPGMHAIPGTAVDNSSHVAWTHG